MTAMMELPPGWAGLEKCGRAMGADGVTVRLEDKERDEVWLVFLDALDKVAAHHLADERITDELARAEGPRYLLRLLASRGPVRP